MVSWVLLLEVIINLTKKLDLFCCRDTNHSVFLLGWRLSRYSPSVILMNPMQCLALRKKTVWWWCWKWNEYMHHTQGIAGNQTRGTCDARQWRRTLHHIRSATKGIRICVKLIRQSTVPIQLHNITISEPSMLEFKRESFEPKSNIILDHKGPGSSITNDRSQNTGVAK